MDGDGTVYVADRENSRIQLFTADGTFRGEWTDVARPCQVFIDRAGLGLTSPSWDTARLLARHRRRRAGRDRRPGERLRPATAAFSRAGAAAMIRVRRATSSRRMASGSTGRGDVYVAEVALSGGGREGLVPASCHTLQKFVRE